MMNATSTSNASFIVNVGETYPYPSHVSAPNFVTMKLTGKDTYSVWETQILCLLKSHQMYGFIDGQFPSPAGNGKGKVEDMEAWIISDSLVKGWILGSLSDGVAKKVVNRLKPKHKKTDFTAKDLWNELQRSYGPPVREQATETKSPTRQAESVIEVSSISEDAESVIEVISKSEDAKSKEGSTEFKMTFGGRFLFDEILQGMTTSVINNLGRTKPWDKLTNDGNTILHVAVASSTKNDHVLLKKLLEMTPEKYTLLDSDGNEIQNTLLDLVNSDGSTLLHVAAIGANIKAIDMLVERTPELLLATDNEGHIPLALSVSNMHIKTSECLFKHMKAKGYDALFTGKSGEELVVLAISSQDFRLANMIIKDYPDAILSDTDAVLTALAQNFPRELNFWERGWREEYTRIAAYHTPTLDRFLSYVHSSRYRLPIKILAGLIYLLFAGLLFLTTMIYQFCGVFVRLFVKETSQIYGYARTLLDNVCDNIRNKRNKDVQKKKPNKDVSCTNSIIEATRRNTSTFIRTIMWRFPDAISSTNEDGHNFIQYSVINRSEKIYNLLYEMSEHKNVYKTIKDSSGNNLLHLAARLAPTNKLNLITGAALQTQRELQWFKEVERFVCPLNRIQKNLDDETPEMVFTREHKDLVIKGENWIKKTAESYTITTALIITIVFAAAITVPGGNNQESGIPIFANNNAFKIFGISDAMSLFTAVTSLLIFLSILTTERFVEQDFLLKLPTKLIIGLTMLFLSATSMIIAFGATLFLVFAQSNSSMLIPIGVLTCLPITSFVTLQFPLIVELIRATYCGGFFVREGYGYFY